MTRVRPPKHTKVLLVAVLLALIPATARAQASPSVDLARASLEELMNLRITSAERKEQRAADVAAAVYVVTQDDIRRSGFTRLPEIFRLVPGMQVAQVNASEYAVAVRGFNSLYSDKLLVLVDGRSLYNRGFSGVFWDGQNMLVSDIDRIEVVRGPGGTAWGANAVNGVINIITKSAADTMGTVADVSVGTFERDSASIRYGGALHGLAYRVYLQWLQHDAGLTAARQPAGDEWDALTTGARADWSRGADSLMFQGTYMNTDARPHWLTFTSFLAPPSSEAVSDIDDGSGLARWTHRGSSRSVFQLQAFTTVSLREDSTLHANERTVDVDAQYQRAVHARHDIVVGGGYRNSALSTRQSFTTDIPSDTTTVLNGFAQDEVSLSDAVKVTVGSKLEHDTFAGWGLLPSASLMWKLEPWQQRAWASVARARRTPGAAYRSIRIYFASFRGQDGVPVVVGLTGNKDYRSETLVDMEGGYRLQVGTASLGVTAFRGRYSNSSTIEPLPPTFELTPAPPHVFVSSQYDNLLSVTTRGLEVSGHWSPAPMWRLDGSYSHVRYAPDLDPASLDATAAAFDGNAPRHQWQFHTTVDLSSRLQVDGGVYHVGRLWQSGIAAYTRADARLEFKITKHLAAIVVGQNLLQSAHREFSDSDTGLVGSLVPRSGRVQLRWQF